MKNVSLHIGLNFVDRVSYRGWGGELTGAVNDANDIANIAAEKGFDNQFILLNETATKQNFHNYLCLIANKIEVGGNLLITYSGHGGQVLDRNKDEFDNQDETWCLYDGQITDDEIKLYLSQMKGVHIILISDSCHSGTIAKSLSSPGRSKAMPIQYQVAVKTPDPIIKTKKTYADLVTLSACQDNQVSWDVGENGLFTQTLKNYVNTVSNYTELISKIKKDIQTMQNPRLGYEGGKEILNRKPLQLV